MIHCYKNMYSIVFTFCILCFYLPTVAQDISFHEYQAPLEKMLQLIAKQTQVTFSYNRLDLANSKPITLTAQHLTLREALALCFAQQPLTCHLFDKKNVQVVRKAPWDTLTAVYGRVANEKDEPVAGVCVTARQAGCSITTRADGSFVLLELPPHATLIAHGMGYAIQKMAVQGRLEVLITLQPLPADLQEVKVNVPTGHQQENKERITGSFVKLAAEKLAPRTPADITRTVALQTPGVEQTNGNLSIRGRSTLFGNTSPLFVADDFPYSGNIKNINSNDLESITVLKDAAAASLWGAQGGNGALVLTTKRGYYHQPRKIEVNNSITISEKPDLFQDPRYLNSADFIDLEVFLFNKGFYNTLLQNTTTHPGYTPVVNLLYQQRRGMMDSTAVAAQLAQWKQRDVRKEVDKYFYRPGVWQQYFLNISEGYKRVAYYGSISYSRQLDNLVANDNHRLTLAANATWKPVDRLELSAGIYSISRTEQADNTLNTLYGQTTGDHTALYPYAELRNAQGQNSPITMAYADEYTQSMQQKGLLNWQFVPLDELGRYVQNTIRTIDTRMQLAVKYTLLKGLDIEARYQHFTSRITNGNIRQEESYYVRNLVNSYTTFTASGQPVQNFPPGALLIRTTDNITAPAGRLQLNYRWRGSKSRLTALAGMEAREAKQAINFYQEVAYNRRDPAAPPFDYDSLDRSLPGRAGYLTNPTRWDAYLDRFSAWYANAAYTLWDKYTVSVSGRIDRSNFFGYEANRRRTPLWSAGIKWNMLKQLTLRTTYGLNGNYDKTATPLTQASNALGNTLSGAPYAKIVQPGNAGLGWEQVRQFNIGMQFTVVHNRLSGTIEYYTKKGSKLIGDAPVDPTTGVRTMTGNFASIAGRGMDIQLQAVVVDHRQFTWSSTLLCSYAGNTITGYQGARDLAILGGPITGLYAYEWAGLDPQTGDPQGIKNGMISKDYPALNNIPLKDKKYMGTQSPKWVGNFQSVFRYRQLSLSFIIGYKLGYVFQRNSIDYSSLFSLGQMHEDYTKRWQQPGDERHTNVPSLVYPVNASRQSFYANSAALVESADHIRLEEIRAIYAIPVPFFHKEFQLQCYFTIDQAGILWKQTSYAIDPGYIDAPAPVRAFTAGFSISF